MRITNNVRVENPVVSLRAKRSNLKRIASSLSLLAMTLLIILLATISYFTLPSAFADDWPQVGRDPQHSGYSPETLGTNFRVAWTYPFQPERIYSQVQAIVYQGRVFVGTEMGNMYAIDATSGQANSGKRIWSYKAGGPILSSVAADSNRVYFTSLDGAVYALDADSGSLIWKTQIMSYLGFSNSPIIGDNKILLGGQDGYFYALNPSDGQIIWKYKVGSPILMTAAYNNGKAFFGAMDMRVYALNTSPAVPGDPASILAWQSSKVQGMAFKDYWPVITQGKVIFRSLDHHSNAGIMPGYPWGWRIGDSASGFWNWLIGNNRQNSDLIAAGNMTQVAELMNSQDSVITDYQLRPQNYIRNTYIFDEASGQDFGVFPDKRTQALSGTVAPPCIDRDGFLIVPVEFVASGWGRLDLNRKRIVDLLYDGYTSQNMPLAVDQSPAGFGNGDENLDVTCTANMVLSLHFQEGNANYTGAFNLDTRRWIGIGDGHRSYQMSEVLERSNNAGTVANGLVYHISWHELITRTTN